MKVIKTLALGLVALSLTACASTGGMKANGLAATGASQAKPPVAIQSEAEIKQAMACFGATWPFADAKKQKKYNVGVGSTFDNTGKAKMSGEGATGRFLSEDASPFIRDALFKASFDTTDVTTNYLTVLANTARSGGAGGTAAYNSFMSTDMPDVFVKGEFIAMDFTGGANVDLMIGPIGPIAQQRGVIVSTSVTVLDAKGQVLGSSILRQFVSYSSLGFGVAGTKSGTLVTGGATVADQQQLQFEAARLPMVIGTLDAMSQASASMGFHSPAIEQCRGLTTALLTHHA